MYIIIIIIVTTCMYMYIYIYIYVYASPGRGDSGHGSRREPGPAGHRQPRHVGGVRETVLRNMFRNVCWDVMM